MTGQSIDTLDTPALLVDLDVLERNVQRMSEFAGAHGVALRPHAKSHKTLGIARRQVDAGSAGLTVAKLDEAEAFVDAGFLDLFVANEVVGETKWRRLAELQRRARVAVGIDSLLGAHGVAEAAREAGTTVPVLIEVDSGLGRAGVQPGEPALEVAQHITPLRGLRLEGVFTHAGHAYAASSPAEVERIGKHEGEALVATAQLLRASGLSCPVVSVGSTPTVRAAGAVAGVTEVRPGNYVFCDRMQVGLGSARLEDCALSVLVSVISRPSPERVVVDGGSKTFALDLGAHGNTALQGYGFDSVRGLRLERLSEEHGVLSLPPQLQRDVGVGDRLRFVPNHACTTANLADTLFGIRDGCVVELLPVLVRGGGR
jgi:D-serine deaminase-like pyridoxal phosphate-dependent protein